MGQLLSSTDLRVRLNFNLDISVLAGYLTSDQPKGFSISKSNKDRDVLLGLIFMRYPVPNRTSSFELEHFGARYIEILF